MSSTLGYVLWGYNVLLYLLLCAVTYKTRNIPSTHSEFGSLCVLSVLIPLGGLIVFSMSGTEADPVGYFRIALTVWILTIGPLLLQLGPIFLRLYVISQTNTWIEKIRKGKGSFEKASAMITSKFGNGSGGSNRKESTANTLPTVKNSASIGEINISGNEILKTGAVFSPPTTRKARPLSSRPGSVLSLNQSMKNLAAVPKLQGPVGRSLDTHRVVIQIPQNQLGWRSKWILGSLAVDKIGDKAVYIIFTGLDKDSPCPSLAFRLKPDAIKAESAPREKFRLIIETFDGQLVVDFVKPGAERVFMASADFLLGKA
ncbi:UNVERIFIED_CONTAM: hypothetical protein HDU68_001234 [Siphonaria sp. JEL0065]|nr:hypothetical protein HDU68_001234 [Siphonaria sp. JEL0065]